MSHQSNVDATLEKHNRGYNCILVSHQDKFHRSVYNLHDYISVC